MKIVQIASIISVGSIATSKEWLRDRQSIHKAIEQVDWPYGSGKFTIYSDGTRASHHINGVVPIKKTMLERLKQNGWELETKAKVIRLNRADNEEPLNPEAGDLDGVLRADYGTVAVEWETGNISSSHRAVNKMLLAMIDGDLAAGVLVVPSRRFYWHLTDRIGNFQELEPYLRLWKTVSLNNGVLEIVEIEHDDVSAEVDRIPKGTDGRALR